MSLIFRGEAADGPDAREETGQHGYGWIESANTGDDILLVDTLRSNMKSIEISYKWRCYWRKIIYEWGNVHCHVWLVGGNDHNVMVVGN